MSVERELLSAAPDDQFTDVNFQWDNTVFDDPKPISAVGDELPRPFIVVKPCALDSLETVQAAVVEAGFPIERTVLDKDYVDLAKYLYGTPTTEDVNSYEWLMLLNSMYDGGVPPSAALLFRTEVPTSKEEYDERITALKGMIRSQLGRQYFRFNIAGQEERTWIHPVHAPEYEDLEREYGIVTAHAQLQA